MQSSKYFLKYLAMEKNLFKYFSKKNCDEEYVFVFNKKQKANNI